LVLARQAYCWYGRNYIGGRGTHKIGRDLGGFDHATVITSTRTFADLLDSHNPDATELLKQIQKRLNYETKTNPAAV
jgi:chromosomal replication initiation ATPase DnaA